MYAVKFREKGKTIFFFVTPEGKETRQRAHAAMIEDLAEAANYADKLAADNPTYDVKVLDLDSAREVVASRIAAARGESATMSSEDAEAPATEADDAPAATEDTPLIEDTPFTLGEPEPSVWVDQRGTRHVREGGEGLYQRGPCGKAGLQLPPDQAVDDCATCFPAAALIALSPEPEYDPCCDPAPEVDQRPAGWDETATGPTDQAEPEPVASQAISDVPDAIEPTEPVAELGEVFHNADDPTGVAHAIAELGETTFTSVCGQTFRYGEPADARAKICDYCYLGVAAPAPEPKPVKAAKPDRRGRPPRTQPEPTPMPVAQFTEQVDALHAQTLALAAQIAEAGSSVDARALIGNLRVALESVKSTLPKGQPRVHTAGEDRPTNVPIGPKSVSVDGQVFNSMAEAATLIAERYPSASECRKYVQKKSAGQSLNARLFIRADLSKGHLPADAVVFGTSEAA